LARSPGSSGDGFDTAIAKLGDFGLAINGGGSSEMSTRHNGSIAGTFNYMSPEMFNGGGDIRSPLIDVWSLGIVMLCVAMKPLRPLERRLLPAQISKMLSDADFQRQGDDSAHRDHLGESPSPSGWVILSAIQAMLQEEQSKRLSASEVLRCLQATHAPPEHVNEPRDEPLVPGVSDVSNTLCTP